MTDNATVTAFDWVPEFARGLVRDLRARWAFEEIERPYDVKLLGAMNPRPDDYLAWQPFDQVPAFADGDLSFFETGAILLYLGEQDERLLPTEPQARWNAISWLFAALNSVETPISRLVSYDLFNADKDWAKSARPSAEEMVDRKLMRVANALGEKEWLAGQFSIADIMMVTVLTNLRHTEMIEGYPVLAAYMRRAQERPAYQRALEAQMADFTAPAPAGWA